MEEARLVSQEARLVLGSIPERAENAQSGAQLCNSAEAISSRLHRLPIRNKGLKVIKKLKVRNQQRTSQLIFLFLFVEHMLDYRSNL